MADYKVGNLQIAFEAIDKTSADFKELAKNLRALQKLITNIGNADITPFVNNIKALRKEMSPLLTKIQGASQGIADFNSVAKQFGINNISKATTDFTKITQAVEETTEKSKDLTESIKSGEKQAEKVPSTLNKIWSAIKKTTTELASLSITTEKSSKSWKKLLKSIGRIALYRTIRRAIQLVTQSVVESVQEFAKVDDNVNKMMSNITSSLQVIKLSFGATILPLLQAIEPILSQIAVAFANFANTISASMATGDTYWAINAKAVQDYRKQLEKTTGSLASFDKIQSLNAKDTFSFFEEKSVESLNEELGNTKSIYQSIREAISSISNLLGSVFGLIIKIGNTKTFQLAVEIVTKVVSGLAKAVGWIVDILDKTGLIEPILAGILFYLGLISTAKIITWLASGSIIKWLGAVISLLKEDFRGTLKLLGGDLVKVMTSTTALFAGISALAGSVMYLATQWGNLTQQQKVLIPVLGALIGLIVGIGTALVLSVTAIKEALKLNPAAIAKAAITAGLFSAAAGITIGTAISTSKNAAKAQAMANGGIPSVGTLFYAGEAGAETVTVGSSGRTEVTNVSQMETALYNALVRYGRENRGSDSAIQINIDGQRVFEAVQRTANRKGLGFSRV